MHPFFDKYLAGTPDACPQLVMDKLADVGELGCTPKSGAQASAMVTTAVNPLAYSVKVHGGLTPQNLARCKTWINTQLMWRWSGDVTLQSGPQKYATALDGKTLLLNTKGQWITVEKWDGQHLDVDTFLIIAAATGEALPLYMANDILTEMEAAGEFEPGLMDGNTRRHTNPLRALGSWYAATGDVRALTWIKNILTRLNLLCSKPGKDPIPYLTVNTKEQSDPNGDHKGNGCCTWMEVRAAQAIDELEGYLGALSPLAIVLRGIARQCLVYAQTHPAVTVPHTLLADYDPSGMVNYFEPCAMDRWSLPALLNVDEDAAKAWYFAADWTLPTDNWFMSGHNFGITARLAGRFGWRS